MQLSCGVARALSRSLELAAFARWISVVVAVSRCFSQPLSFCASFSVFFHVGLVSVFCIMGPPHKHLSSFTHTYTCTNAPTASTHMTYTFPTCIYPPHNAHTPLPLPTPSSPSALCCSGECWTQMPCSQVSSGRYVQNAKPGMSLSLKRCSGSLGGKRGRKIFNALDLTLVISRARCWIYELLSLYTCFFRGGGDTG